MTTPTLTVQNLFDAESAALKLKWVAGRNGSQRLLEPGNAKFPGMALVGHLNFVHPNRVQVIGGAEMHYRERLGKGERADALQQLFSCDRTAAVIVCRDRQPAADFKQAADRQRMALFATPQPSPLVIDHLQYYLTRALAPRASVHGVYMEVMGMGLLITGEAGIGKSEIALELLSRGHRLIADDAVEFIRVGPDVLVGQCFNGLSDFLEVRGLGILDVRMMFGETAVRHKKRLHLIVRLEQLKKSQMGRIDRLQAQQRTRRVLDVDVSEVVLFVAPGRNLSVLIEVAVRTHILRNWGYNPVEDFIKRQQALIDGNRRGRNKPAGPD